MTRWNSVLEKYVDEPPNREDEIEVEIVAAAAAMNALPFPVRRADIAAEQWKKNWVAANVSNGILRTALRVARDRLRIAGDKFGDEIDAILAVT